MTLHLQRSHFHPGELALQRLLHGTPLEYPNAAGFPANYVRRVTASPIVAFGALDAEGRPWTTMLGGEAGFARATTEADVRALEDALSSSSPSPSRADGGGGARFCSATPLRPDCCARSLVDLRYDPVIRALFHLDDKAAETTRADDREQQQQQQPMTRGGGDRLMSALSIDLASRDRVKLMGRLAAGVVNPVPELGAGVAGAHLVMEVQESLGNCPKYLNKKAIRPHVPTPTLCPEDDTLPLSQAALDLLGRADIFFISSFDGRGMDTNHRGGPPGFVRVVTNDNNNTGDEDDGGGVSIIYPEYSGNRLYNTLGNVHERPLVGLCVPDFATGDVLHLTGEARILVGADAARLLPRTKLAVRIRVTAARLVRAGLPFRGDVIDYSPYNPPVRRLAGELTTGSAGAVGGDAGGDKPAVSLRLLERKFLTETIARFTFSLVQERGVAPSSLPGAWVPGQHVTLDFAPELDVGWSHMREDDPGSLNDDYVRTFTVSNAPPPGTGPGPMKDGTVVQITMRRHGPVTALLWRWNLRAPLEVGVLGFGGGEGFRIAEDEGQGGGGGGEEGDNEGRRRGRDAVFVAAGVGITPILAQAPGLLASAATAGRFRVLWSLKGEDLPFAADEFERIPGLAAATVVYVTGEGVGEDVVARLGELGSTVVRRRIGQEDVLSTGEAGNRRYYLCTGPGMMKVLLQWLNGEDAVYESFEY